MSCKTIQALDITHPGTNSGSSFHNKKQLRLTDIQTSIFYNKKKKNLEVAVQNILLLTLQNPALWYDHRRQAWTTTAGEIERLNILTGLPVQMPGLALNLCSLQFYFLGVDESILLHFRIWRGEPTIKRRICCLS